MEDAPPAERSEEGYVEPLAAKTAAALETNALLERVGEPTMVTFGCSSPVQAPESERLYQAEPS